MYYRGAAAAIVVYDITTESSFKCMKKWVKELRQFGPKDIIIAVAGNKCDLEDQREVGLSCCISSIRRERTQRSQAMLYEFNTQQLITYGKLQQDSQLSVCQERQLITKRLFKHHNATSPIICYYLLLFVTQNLSILFTIV